MTFTELFLIAVGLSMDAFAVAVCKGLCMRRFYAGQALIIGLFFGGFQAIMPLLGWALGTRFAGAIESVDHWVAFVLLLFIGGKMMYDSFHEDDEVICNVQEKLDLKQLTMMAVATSIDALAVGVTFAFLQVSIVPSVCVIGVTTLVLSIIGVAIGHRFGTKYKNKAELAGGIILVLIGLKILLEHLDVVHF